MLQRKKKKFALFLSVNLIVIFSCLSVAYAITNSDISIQYPSSPEGFFMKGTTYNLKVNVNNNPDSVKFYCPEESWFADFSLNKVAGTANSYEAKWTPGGDDSAPAKDVGGRYVGFNEMEFAASNKNGTGQQYRTYHVPALSIGEYKDIDNQFSYSSPYANDFDKPYTTKYNCAAYSVGVFNEWFNAGKTQKDAIDFMKKEGNWKFRAGLY